MIDNFKINVFPNIKENNVETYNNDDKRQLSKYAEKKSLENKNLKNVLRKLVAE